MPRMTGARAAVQALRSNGAGAVFGIPGVHNILMYDALIDSGVPHYVTRHEQGAGFMADGFARATGRPGVCLPITGPGLTNISTPVGQAWTDSSPLLVVSSQIESDICDKQKGTLHELKNQMGFMAEITEWNARAKDPVDCVTQVNRAFSWLATSRPRPLHIEVPMDVQAMEADVELAAGAAVSPRRPDPDDIEKAVRLLAGKSRPVLFVGGGAITSGAGNEVLELSEALGAAVLTTCQGKGIIPEDHPSVIGGLATDPKVEEFLATCDVTVAIGTHFGASDTSSWKARLPKPIIHIDIDSEEFCRNFEAEVKIHADARQALLELLDALSQARVMPGDGAARALSLREECLAQAKERIPWEWNHLQVVRRALGRDGILVCDMTSICYPATRYYPVYEPRTFMFPRGFGTLGFSPPVAFGAKIGKPDRKVVAIVGDGGFMFTCQDLATAAQYSIPVVTVIVNSNSYETVKRFQTQRFGRGRETDVDLVNPDFMKFADSFGVWAKRACGVDEFERTLHEALDVNGPAIVEIPHGR